ncbi:MAG: FAD-binding oxidoreductase [Sulfurifustaceae bacterium]
MDRESAQTALRQTVGADYARFDAEIDPRHFRDWWVPIEHGRPFAVVRPRTTEEVSAVLRTCHARRLPVVAQGGLTGLSGGATPIDRCVILSLDRLRGVEELDAAAATLTAWAGTPLQTIQEAAQDAGFFFPLDLGARGSCQIGGNLSTNAGGNRVIRYGMTRDLVLGLEVVLADGTVVSSLNKMIKNNTGYDLKQLFIGAEGTLGIITRVVLRLHPQAQSMCTALCAVSDYDKAVALLRHAKQQLAGMLSAFEMMWPDFYELVTRNVPGLTPPLPHGHGGYVLVELLGADQIQDQARFEAMLHAALEQELVRDAVVAQSRAESQAFWRLRDASGELPQIFDPHGKFDVSIPTKDIGRFVDACRAAVKTRWPNARTVTFGHIGDSNIHFNVHVDGAAIADVEHEIEAIVYGLVREWRGSISAEHGVGTLKRSYLAYSRAPEEIALMRTLKQALDPHGILNPGKIF